MANHWQHVLGVIVEVVIPGVFLNLHHLLARVLHESLVDVASQSLEAVAHNANEWLEESFLMRHFLARLSR